jgi:hypothetical protein
MPQFIGQEVQVRRAGRGGPPQAFDYGGREHRVAEVRRRWRMFDFRRPWWRRPHRDHYVVRTEAGETFELYFHRGPGRRYWVLYRELDR